MKKILLFSLMSIMLASCSQSNPFETQLVEHLRKQMKNPDSFRMDSVNYKPLYLSDNLKSQLKSDSIMMVIKAEGRDSYQESVERNQGISYMTDLVKMYKQNVMDYQNQIDSLENHMVNTQKLLSEVKNTDKDTLTRHTYKVYYMAQNSFGAMIKGEAFLSTFDGKDIYMDVE